MWKKLVRTETKIANLCIFLLEFFTDFECWHRPTQRFWHFAQNSGGWCFQTAQIITLTRKMVRNKISQIMRIDLIIDWNGLTSLCCLDLAVKHHFLNFSSIFFGSDLRSSVSVSENSLIEATQTVRNDSKSMKLSQFMIIAIWIQWIN